MRLRFQVLNSKLKGLQFETHVDAVRVGRSSRNDLVLKLPSVSRHHATVRRRDGGVVLEDSGSRNETRVDGVIVHGSAPLCAGAIISFSDVMVQVSFLPEQEGGEEVTPIEGVEVPAAGSADADLAGADSPYGEGPKEPPAAAPVEAFALQGEEEAEEVLPAEMVEEEPQAGSPDGDLVRRTANRTANAKPPAAGGARPVAAVPESWFAPPAVPEQALPPEAAAERLERSLWPAFVLVCAILGSLALIAYFLNRAGQRDLPAAECGTVLQVAEERLVQVRSGFIRDPKGYDRDVVAVLPPPSRLPIIVALRGVSEGFTSMRLYNADGSEFIILHVRVLARRQEKVEQFLEDQGLSAQQKRALAADCVRRGEARVQDGMLYEAKQQLLRALALRRSLPGDEAAVRQVLDALDRLETVIDERYKQLMFEMARWLDDGDMKMAAVKLAELKEMLPDETDIRRQNVDLFYRLLVRQIELDKKRGRGKGL